MQFKTVDAALDFAIAGEEESYKFYMDLATKMDKAWMEQVFVEFAGEEEKHKAKLLAIKEGKLMVTAGQEITDLKISDYLVDAEIKPDMDYQEALLVAMKKEKAAFVLYNLLSEATNDESLQVTFKNLAQEEAKHKLRFEIEYDDFVLKEN